MNHREHEEFMTRVVSGELAASSPEAQARFETCPECRQEFKNMQDLERSLDVAFEQEREILAEATRRGPGPRDEVEKALAAAQGASTATSTTSLPGTSRVTTWIAAAAAILLVATWFWMDRQPQEVPRDPLLLGGDVRCIRPAGEVGSYGLFEWSHPLPSAGWYSLTIHEVLPEGSERVVIGFEDGGLELREPRWDSQAADSPPLPPSILWTVEVFDGTGQRKAKGEQRASLKP